MIPFSIITLSRIGIVVNAGLPYIDICLGHLVKVAAVYPAARGTAKFPACPGAAFPV